MWINFLIFININLNYNINYLINIIFSIEFFDIYLYIFNITSNKKLKFE